MSNEQADDLSIIDEAIKFLSFVTDVESQNRADGLVDLKFRYGEQWPVELMNSRQLEQRPCLTINKLDSFCRTVENQQRQQRPRIKVHPTNTTATKKVADVIQGMFRHIEVRSNAETAFDTAFSHAITIGWGYWHITGDYASDDSMDQELNIDTIDNPFSVYFDPNSILPDGSDAERCLITSKMSKEAFRKLYPNADTGSNFSASGSGDGTLDWITKEDIRVAEFYKIKRVPDMLYQLSDKTTVYKQDIPPPEVMAEKGLMIVGERKSWKLELHWYKVTAMEILDYRILPGKFIPVVPVYGNVIIHDGKRRKYGMVKFAKDAQRQVNYWETAATESLALAPKAKWIMAEGQDEGHENEWNKANMSAMPVLRFKQTDIDGQPAPAPQRLQPEPPPDGLFTALKVATDNMREVLGITDPAMRDQGMQSGKAINAQQVQSDISTFHYYDNLTRSIAHTGRILLDLLPHYYDTERTMRIIGDDGKPDLITINGRKTTPEGEVIDNNITAGEYDVTMDIGPGYNSKRLEAIDAMAPLLGNEQLFAQMGDLYFRNSDFPGADVIADRLAALNPLAQIDDHSDIPQSAQIKMKQQEQQIQQMQQQLSAAHIEIETKRDLEKMKQDAETQREHLRQTVKAHDIETQAKASQQDTEMKIHGQAHDKALDYKKAMDVEELRGKIAMILQRMGENEDMVDKPKFPTYNSKGHRLHKDKNGNYAYISERGEVTEV